MRRRAPGTEMTRSTGSMVQVRIGNQVYDAVHVSSCHTCTHPARMMIEEKILQLHPWRRIAELYSEKEIEVEDGRTELMPKVSFQSIYHHYQSGHMPLEAATLRRLAERRAQKLGHSMEEASDRLVDQYTFSEAVVHQAYDRMVSGEIRPEVKDGLAAAKFLQDVEDRTAAGFDSEAWSQAMTVYFETARTVMAPETWARFTEALSRNPILRALETQLNPAPDNDNDDGVLDAEIVGETHAR